jgi:hypothetical protein
MCFLFILIPFLINLNFSTSVSITHNLITIDHQSSSEWWDKKWEYCSKIEITNTGKNLTYYQILVELSPSIFTYELANIDGSDIRFLNKANTTELNYWIEEWNPIGESYIWVKIPFIPAFGNEIIFLYYGNENAESHNDGRNTFMFFDDFLSNEIDDTIWNVIEAISDYHYYEVNNSEWHVYAEAFGTGNYSGYRLESAFKYSWTNFSVTMKSRWDNLDYDKGYSVWNGLDLVDDDSQVTATSLALWGDFNTVIHKQLDGDFSYTNVPEFIVGSSKFQYDVINSSFTFNIQGTYNHTLTTSLVGFKRPFYIRIPAILEGRDVSQVSVDSYFDYIFIRKLSINEPIVVVNSYFQTVKLNINFGFIFLALSLLALGLIKSQSKSSSKKH